MRERILWKIIYSKNLPFMVLYDIILLLNNREPENFREHPIHPKRKRGKRKRSSAAISHTWKLWDFSFQFFTTNFSFCNSPPLPYPDAAISITHFRQQVLRSDDLHGSTIWQSGPPNSNREGFFFFHLKKIKSITERPNRTGHEPKERQFGSKTTLWTWNCKLREVKNMWSALFITGCSKRNTWFHCFYSMRGVPQTLHHHRSNLQSGSTIRSSTRPNIATCHHLWD